jgi:hypothetical protein
MDEDNLSNPIGPTVAGNVLQEETVQESVVTVGQVQGTTDSSTPEAQSSRGNDSDISTSSPVFERGNADEAEISFGTNTAGFFQAAWTNDALATINNMSNIDDSLEFGAEGSGAEFLPNVQSSILAIVDQVAERTPPRVREVTSHALNTVKKTRNFASGVFGRLIKATARHGGSPRQETPKTQDVPIPEGTEADDQRGASSTQRAVPQGNLKVLPNQYSSPPTQETVHQAIPTGQGIATDSTRAIGASKYGLPEAAPRASSSKPRSPKVDSPPEIGGRGAPSVQRTPTPRAGYLFSGQEPMNVACALLNRAFTEMGAVYDVIDKSLWNALWMFANNEDMGTWTGLQEFMTKRHRDYFLGRLRDVYHNHFVASRLKEGPILDILPRVTERTLEILVDYMTKKGNDRPWHKDGRIPQNQIGDYRLTSLDYFLDPIQEEMKRHGYPLTDTEVELLKNGIPGATSLPATSPLVIFWEKWQARHKDDHEGALQCRYVNPRNPLLPDSSGSQDSATTESSSQRSQVENVLPYITSDEEDKEDTKPSAKVRYDETCFVDWNHETTVLIYELYDKTMENCPLIEVSVDFSRLMSHQVGGIYRVLKELRGDKWMGFMAESISLDWLNEVESRLHEKFQEDFWYGAAPHLLPVTRLLQEYVLRQIPEFLAGYAHSYIRGDVRDTFQEIRMTASKTFVKGWNEIVLSAVKYGKIRIADAKDGDGKAHVEAVEDVTGNSPPNVEGSTSSPDQDNGHRDAASGTPDQQDRNDPQDVASGIPGQQDHEDDDHTPNVDYPQLDPPANLSHCAGYFKRNEGGKIVWKSHLPPLTLEQLPRNIKYIKSHWDGRILADGTTVIGQRDDGTFVATCSVDTMKKATQGKDALRGSTGVSEKRAHPTVPIPTQGFDRRPLTYEPIPHNQDGESYGVSHPTAKEPIPPKTEGALQGEHQDAVGPYLSYAYGDNQNATRTRQQGAPRDTTIAVSQFPYSKDTRTDDRRGLNAYDMNAYDRMKSFSTPYSAPIRHWSFTTPYDQPTKRVAIQGEVHQNHWNNAYANSILHTASGYSRRIAGDKNHFPTHPMTVPHGNQGLPPSGTPPGHNGGGNPPHHTPPGSSTYDGGFPNPGGDPNSNGGSGGGGGGGGGGPSYTSGHPPTGNNDDIKGFQCKPDLKAYNEFKQPEQYASWIEDTVAVMRAQGLGELLDPTYVPKPEERKAFLAKQAFTYMMLKKKVRTMTGARIVKNHKASYDAQTALLELAKEGTQSTTAVLAGRVLLSKLTSQKFDPRNGKMTAMEFITKFETMVEEYNDLQEHLGTQLSDEFRKTLLTASVSTVSILRSISDREQESLVRGGRPFAYHEYATILKTQAVLFDEQFAGRRSVNLSDSYGSTGDTDDQGVIDEINEFCVNVMRRRAPGASMNKDTWESLSAEGKSTWDKLEEADKRKILQYAAKRAEKGAISANVTEIDPDANEPEEEHATDANGGEFTEAEINSAITQARKNAHAGDARRVMSGKPRAKGSAQIKNVNFLTKPEEGGNSEHDELERAISRYWNPTSNDAADFQEGG